MYQIRPRRDSGAFRSCAEHTYRGFCFRIRPSFLFRAPVMVTSTWLVVLILLTFGGDCLKRLQDVQAYNRRCGSGLSLVDYGRVKRAMINGSFDCSI